MVEEFKNLEGKIISEINNTSDEMIFITNEGNYKLYHAQDCCECVEIEDICGDLNDLLNSPILLAEEIIHENDVNPEGVPKKEFQDAFTWTFYKLATINGYVTIRWYGESNGYYAETVDFKKMEV